MAPPQCLQNSGLTWSRMTRVRKVRILAPTGQGVRRIG